MTNKMLVRCNRCNRKSRVKPQIRKRETPGCPKCGYTGLTKLSPKT